MPRPDAGDAGDAPAPPPPGVALVRLAAPLVPAHRRAEWLAEWSGELAWSWRERARRGEPPIVTRLRLRSRALGAVADALWLRRRHRTPFMLDLDLRHAARSLRRRPGFASVVVLTLALGIGATTAIFSVVYGVLLRPLPLPHPERVVTLEGRPLDGDPEKVGSAASYPDYLDFRAHARSFAALAAARDWTVTLAEPGAEPARVRATYATPELLPVLGLAPHLGRAFEAADAASGAAPVALVSHGAWQRRWGGDAGIVGRRVQVDGAPATIVGVLPAGLRVRAESELWLPLVPGPLEAERGVHRLALVGRLRAGVALEQAGAEVEAIAARLAAAHPADNANRGAAIVPLREAIVGDARPALLLLLGAVALVLLIACTNLASLFLARAASREREMAVRAALGAGRGRLVRQWMTESLLLTAVGAVAGLAVAWAGMRALLALTPRALPRATEVALDLPVLAFLGGVSLVVALVFGALPALQRRGGGGLDALRDGARGATAGRARRRLREALVLAEVAFATVLVLGAALLLKSAWLLQRAPLSLEPRGVLVAQLQLPLARYDSAGAVLRFHARLREEVGALPGVDAVSLAHEHPLSAGFTSSYLIVGRERPAPGTEPEARVRPVAPGYFRAVGLPLRRGRDVAPTDDFGAPGVVVVNEAFVRRHFPGENPIGRRLDRTGAWWPGQPTVFEIVGVVADEPFLGPRTPADPATYYPHAQFPLNDMWLVVRAAGDPAVLAAAVRERVRRVDPALPVEQTRPLAELVREATAVPRFDALLLALFAAAALALAAIGIYGVLAYAVAERTREIGVRLALGAPPGRVVRQVLAQGAGMALAGVTLGLVAALGAGPLLETLLVGVAPRDPAVLGAVTALLALVALAAAWLPARRASRVAPLVALRGD